MPPPTKRRRTGPTAIEEITFDLSARHDYLTGFHKRKLQRAKHAQETAERRARAEKLQERKQLREHRKAELERHVEEINAMLRPITTSNDEEDDDEGEGSGEEWDGKAPAEPPAVDHETEYIDEEKYTTVTVETMDVSKEGLFKAQQERDDQDMDGGGKVAFKTDAVSNDKKNRQRTKETPKDRVQKRKKKRNFRYEGKMDRKEARTKQKSKNSRQARERRAAG